MIRRSFTPIATLPPALAVLVFLLPLLAPAADAGFVTGIDPSRTVHLADPANNLSVTAVVPEVFENSIGATYTFTLEGANDTQAATYGVEITVSPADPDTHRTWNATVSVPPGSSTTHVSVSIPALTINGTQANAPFRVALAYANGTPADSVDLSIDLLYHSPPPDGGLFQLAVASGFFWGLVFLYALHLQKAQARLQARADALEGSLEGRSKEGRESGENR